MSLSPKSVVSDVDAGLELMTPSRARVHHLCPAGPHYLGSSQLNTEIVKLIPAPAPTPPLPIPAAISSDILFLTRIDQLHCRLLLLIVF